MPMWISQLLLLSLLGCSVGSSTSLSKSPVAKVIKLLGEMQDKLSDQSKKDGKLKKDMECYCRETVKKLNEDIEAANTRLPTMNSALLEDQANIARFTAEKEASVKEKSDEDLTLKNAQELRSKEADAYIKAKDSAEKSINALGRAMAALTSRGIGGSFLQTGDADVLRQLTATANIRDSDRDVLASFLDSGESLDSQPGAGMVLGILESMKDKMEQDLKEAKEVEAKAVETFAGMRAAKTEQIATLAKEVETKTSRIGELRVNSVKRQADIDSTTKSLEDNTQALRDTQQGCEDQDEAWTERKRLAAEEMAALQEAVEILSSEEALKTMSKVGKKATSFLQVRRTKTNDEKLSRARRALQGSDGTGFSSDPRVAFLALALRSKQVDFSEILLKIDDMIKVLTREQEAEQKKMDWCEAETKSSKDNLKTLEGESQDRQTALAEVKNELAGCEKDLEDKETKIKELDNRVEKATEQRKAENEEYQEVQSGSGKAKDLLNLALNRLKQFYTGLQVSKRSVALFAQRRSRAAKIAAQVAAATADLTSAGDGMKVAGESVSSEDFSPSFVQVSSANLLSRARSQSSNGNSEIDAKAKKPQGAGKYEKQNSIGVLTLLQNLVAEISKEEQVVDLQEENAQKEYDKNIKDARKTREHTTRSIAEKSVEKAGLEKRLETLGQKEESNQAEQAEVKKYLAGLKPECDFLMANWEARKRARITETQGLVRAKKILADSR
mmetsp:Transcript_56170/g.100051  ORF Transcript_56170/g.100051 Transcript_56170/m.100051 type:complete len:730 (-) Transcript_56170:123-2312(-)